MEGIDYEAVLVDLRIKRDELNTAIATIERILGVASTATTTAPGSTPAAAADEKIPKQIESDTFFGLSAVQAAKKYLKMVKRPSATKEIHDGLKAGGFLTNSKSFYSNLYTSIMRSGEFRRVHKKWGLVEWYPNRPMEAPIRKKRRRSTKRRKSLEPKIAAGQKETAEKKA